MHTTFNHDHSIMIDKQIQHNKVSAREKASILHNIDSFFYREYMSLGLIGLSLLDRICRGLSSIRSLVGILSFSAGMTGTLLGLFLIDSPNQLLGCFSPMIDLEHPREQGRVHFPLTFE